jgi:hypothetical protein
MLIGNGNNYGSFCCVYLVTNQSPSTRYDDDDNSEIRLEVTFKNFY